MYRKTEASGAPWQSREITSGFVRGAGVAGLRDAFVRIPDRTPTEAFRSRLGAAVSSVLPSSSSTWLR